MNCRVCDTFLAEGIHICPQCGTPTATYPHDSGPNDPTAPASYARQQFPATSYGPDQHRPTPSDPYSDSEPYEAPPQSLYTPGSPSRPPSRKTRRGSNVALLAGMVLLLIVLIGGGLAFLSHQMFRGQTIHTATVVTNATVAPTAVLNPLKNPYPPGTGTLVINDLLQDNSKGYGWDEASTNATTCQFTAGAYEIDTPLHTFLACYARSSPQFSNFVFEAHMKIVKGDCGALLFRTNNTNGYYYEGNFYDFEVCQDARYEVDVHTGQAKPAFKKLIPLQASPVIHSGLDQDNVLAVVAIGNTLTLYLNHQNIARITDSTYSQGQIGLYASGYYGDPTEVQFSNVKVWTL